MSFRRDAIGSIDRILFDKLCMQWDQLPGPVIILPPCNPHLLILDKIAIRIHVCLEEAAFVTMTTTNHFHENPHPHPIQLFIYHRTFRKDQIGYNGHQDQLVLSRDTFSNRARIGI